jgi:hypothetical protein
MKTMSQRFIGIFLIVLVVVFTSSIELGVAQAGEMTVLTPSEVFSKTLDS